MPSAAAYLCNAAKLFARSLDLQDTLKSMLDLCVPHLGQACVVYLFGESPFDGQVAAVRHVDAVSQELLGTLARRAFSRSEGLQPLLLVARTSQSAVLSQLKTVDLVGDGRAAHILQRDLQLKTAVLVPVAENECVLGVAICFASSTRWYTPRQVRLARELSELFALALKAAQMYSACKAALDSSQDMLATTIHDLFSPLSYIKGSAQRLGRLDWSKADPATMRSEFQQRLSAIDAAATRMASALSALMEATRPQPLALNTAAPADVTDLVTLTRECACLEQLNAPDHLIRVEHDQADSLVGAWEKDDMQRMLANLIGNAVKYSPPGTIVTVRLSTEFNGDDGGWAVVCVSDQGIGIPSGDLPFVFEPFHRGSNVGAVAGTGLGLASVWQTVRIHKGQLSVDSREGSGTLITVRLPLGDPPDGLAVAHATSRSDWPRSCTARPMRFLSDSPADN